MEFYKKIELSGIFYSFMGVLEEVGQVLEYVCFFFGINGVVIFKKSSLVEVLFYIFLDRIVFEMDFFYLVFVFFRGKWNEFFYIKNVVMKFVEIYGLDFKDVDRIIVNNVLKVFKMVE